MEINKLDNAANPTIAMINDDINTLLIGDETNFISDGCHTFGELYHHRALLFASLIMVGEKLKLLYRSEGDYKSFKSWRSKLHHDGTMYEGYFIVGMDTYHGTATYHYPMEYWDTFYMSEEIDRAPEFDGHTPDEALRRIADFFGVIRYNKYYDMFPMKE